MCELDESIGSAWKRENSFYVTIYILWQLAMLTFLNSSTGLEDAIAQNTKSIESPQMSKILEQQIRA